MFMFEICVLFNKMVFVLNLIFLNKLFHLSLNFAKKFIDICSVNCIRKKWKQKSV